MIYDITQELFSGAVYPGDVRPQFTRIKSIDKGDTSNSTIFSMNVHNATHIDAPFHRIKGGKGIDELSLEVCVGKATVIDYENRDKLTDLPVRRILFKNCEQIDEVTATLLVEKGVYFVGVEGQSIGNREVHRILLENEVVVLEGARLNEVPEGEYMLYAPPIKLGGCDGAPCRAILISD